MKHLIDPLIEERTNWLSADRAQVRFARGLLDHLLSYEKIVKLAAEMQDWPSEKDHGPYGLASGQTGDLHRN